MKNIFWLPTLLLVCGFIIGCGKDDCDKKISAVQPNTNPAGYEVLIKTNGFTSAAKVVFGTVAATSRAGGEGGDIIAKVPAGLSGNVEISVEEGDCIARSGGFVVSNGFPSGVQPSLPNIIVPTTTTNFPTQSITNSWVNAADSTWRIFLKGDFVAGFVQLEIDSKEFSNVTYFNLNPITGTVNTNTNAISLSIDRTAKSGGSIEHFNGQFIPVPNSLISKAEYVILLVSRETGRQLVIYYPI